jgi:hypothetical protein
MLGRLRITYENTPTTQIRPEHIGNRAVGPSAQVGVVASQLR